MTAAWLGLAAQGAQSTHWFRDPKCHAHSHTGLASEGVPPRPHGLDESSRSTRRQYSPKEEAFGLKQTQGRISKSRIATGAQKGKTGP